MGLRVLHCPADVGGNAQTLVRAERLLGLDSVCVAFRRNYISYASDEILWRDGTGTFVAELKRLGLLRRAIRDFDVIHFNSGMPILPYQTDGRTKSTSLSKKLLRSIYDIYTRCVEFKDLAIVSRFNKVIAVTYQGDDARQGDYCREHFAITHAREVDEEYYTPLGDSIKKKMISCFNRYADRIYALNPDLLYVLPKRAEFLPYANVDLESWRPAEPSSASKGRPIVVHAPTHRGVKGTRYVIEAVNRLKAGNVDFDFILVENMSHARAMKIYEGADLLIDQLLVGWYGGVAAEFMALGKPVIAYIRQEDLGFIPAGMRTELPVINANPSNVYETLRSLLARERGYLSEVGARSRDYVEKWHNPTMVAARLKKDYEDAWAEKNIRKRCSEQLSFRARG